MSSSDSNVIKSPVSLLDRLSELFYCSKNNFENIKLNNKEESVLKEVFYSIIKGDSLIKGSFQSKGNNFFFISPISDAISYMFSFALICSRLKTVYYREKSYSKKELLKFFISVDDLLFAVSQVYISASNSLETAKKLDKNSKMEVFLQLFNEWDSILLAAFESYILLQSNFQYLNTVFEYFDIEVNKIVESDDFAFSVTLLRHTELGLNEFLDFIDLDSSNPKYSSKKKIYLILHQLNSVITEMLDFKYLCLNELNEMLKCSRICKDTFEKFNTYFIEIFELYRIKVEMTNNVSLRPLNYKPTDNFYDLEAFEDNVLESEFRFLNFYLIQAKFHNDGECFFNQLLTAYKRKNYSDQEIVRFEEGGGVYYAALSFRAFIEINKDFFLSSQIRQEIYLKSQDITYDIRDEITTDEFLINIYSKLINHNKIAIIFLFDHILNMSKLDKNHPCNPYHLTNLLAFMIFGSIDLSEKHLYLFRRFFNLYRTGQLFLPQLLIDTCQFVEEQVILDNYQYNKYLNRSLCNSPKVTEFVTSYLNGNSMVKNFLSQDPSLAQILIKLSLDLINFCLSSDISYEIRNAVIQNEKEMIIFSEEGLIKAYLKIPKFQRSIISYIIGHLIRISSVHKSSVICISGFAKMFGDEVLRFSMIPIHPNQKVDLIMIKAFEKLIYLFKDGKVTCECDLNTNFLMKKPKLYDIFDQLSFIRVIPSQVLRAKFRMLDIHLGNYITLENCMDKPFLTWDSKPDTFYTLLMVDPDGPINKNIKDHCTIHWLVTNIDGDKVENGEEIVTYKHPLPPLGTLYHRYVFLLYKQNHFSDFSNLQIYQSEKVTKRGVFELEIFETKYKLELTALNFFYAERSYLSTLKNEVSNRDEMRISLLRKSLNEEISLL